MEQNDGVLLDAIRRELARGGQVYYLHNHVESIARCANLLQQRLPEARIGVVHGKMTQKEIAAAMNAMADGETDILVCTTIIETGIDIPNANTLIIENADNLGLAQLHLSLIHIYDGNYKKYNISKRIQKVKRSPACRKNTAACSRPVGDPQSASGGGIGSGDRPAGVRTDR